MVAPLIISGLSALGGLFGNRPQQQQTGGTQQSFQDSFTKHQLTPEAGGVFYPTADAFLANLNKDIDLSGYKATQTQNINDLADVKRKALEFQMNQRGIDPRSPSSLTFFNNAENQRFKDISHLNQSIPLLAEEILSKRIAQGTDIFSRLPLDVYQTGGQQTAQQGTVNSPGNMLGGSLGNLASVLAYLFGQGAFGGGNSGNQNPANAGNV